MLQLFYITDAWRPSPRTFIRRHRIHRTVRRAILCLAAFDLGTACCIHTSPACKLLQWVLVSAAAAAAVDEASTACADAAVLRCRTNESAATTTTTTRRWQIVHDTPPDVTESLAAAFFERRKWKQACVGVELSLRGSRQQRARVFCITSFQRRLPTPRCVLTELSTLRKYFGDVSVNFVPM